MNTFLKISLIVVLSLIAIKFSPVLFLGAVIGLILAVVLGAVGFSLVLALLAIALAFALALSPIWIPVLIVMGLVSLFRKLGDKPVAPGVPPVLTA